ncbi:MAG: hypothetical protein DMF89_13745, partial [Acidobacteria bacterium]
QYIAVFRGVEPSEPPGYTPYMARRGIAVVLTLLGAAVFISIAALFLIYLLVGREPPVPSSALLTLRIGGDLADVAPGDIVGFLRGVRTPSLRSIIDALRKARVDARIAAILLKPTGFDSLRSLRALDSACHEGAPIGEAGLPRGSADRRSGPATRERR